MIEAGHMGTMPAAAGKRWHQLLRALIALLALLCATSAAGAALAQEEYQSALRARPDLVSGEQLFATCARCHGAQAQGSADGQIPALAGQHYRVLLRQLIDYRHDMRWDFRMEHYADVPTLSATQDVADVAAYIAGLKRSAAVVSGDGSEVEHGADLYAARCASCHGARAQGSDRNGYPRLATQHYPYLLRQLHDAVEGRRPNFPLSHVRRLAHMDRDDLVGLADYLSRLPP
jgi:cytochrome c553